MSEFIRSEAFICLSGLYCVFKKNVLVCRFYMKNFKESIFIGIGLFFSAVTVILSNSATAQEKTFTMEEAVLGGGGKLFPKSLEQLQWVASSSSYSQVLDNALLVTDARNGKTVSKISKSALNQSLRKSFPSDDTLKRFPKVSWVTADVFKFNANNKIYSYRLTDNLTTFLANYNPSAMENADIEPNNHKVAYTQGNNLFVDGKQITFDDKPGIVNGQAVHRNEFGIVKGIFWSPDGGSLAFYHMDESMVPEYPIYQLSNRPANARNIRYPIAGTPSHHVTVGVYHFATGKTVYLNTGLPAEQYLTNVTWSPDNKSLYIAVVNRAQNHMWLNRYNALTGNFEKTLFEEENARYVEPEHGPMFVKNDPGKFIWWSERDTFNHLYLYATSGQLIRQLTSGKWVVTEVHGFDATGIMLYYSSTVNGATERHLQSVNLKTGKNQKYTGSRAGIHNVLMSSGGDWFLDMFQNQNTPREIYLVNTANKQERQIFKADNPLLGYGIGETTLGTLAAKDGTPLHYRLIKPVNFDPSKKYPVVVYLYNGPHLQLVNNTWLGGANLWMHYMAQRGFVVFTLDGRGSLNRGHAFESAVFRNLGTLELEDQVSGAEFLKNLPYVDANRMGIHGWSFGGFMTTGMMTRHPGVFKAGVAGGPVIDWGLYEIMYTERYMDTPEENPEGYQKSNLLNYTQNLKGKLLMIHGGEDDVVLWQHSLQYLEKCIKEGVQLDYFVYPHHPHNVMGKDRVHLMEKVSRYFIDNL